MSRHQRLFFDSPSLLLDVLNCIHAVCTGGQDLPIKTMTVPLFHVAGSLKNAVKLLLKEGVFSI